MNTTATFKTDRGGRYLKALCHHFGRKVDASCEDTAGWVQFPFGRCELSADDAQLRIYNLSRTMVPPTSSSNSNSASAGNNNAGGGTVPSILNTQTIDTNAWRVQWNVTGTVLASSGDGGVVQVWKLGASNQFECVSSVHGDAEGNSLPAPMDM